MCMAAVCYDSGGEHNKPMSWLHDLSIPANSNVAPMLGEGYGFPLCQPPCSCSLLSWHSKEQARNQIHQGSLLAKQPRTKRGIIKSYSGSGL